MIVYLFVVIQIYSSSAVFFYLIVKLSLEKSDEPYLSDIVPGTKTPSQLGRQFINVPNKHKYTHYVAIDVSGLDVIKGRDGVFVVRGDTDLDISDRIVGSGKIKCGG